MRIVDRRMLGWLRVVCGGLATLLGASLIVKGFTMRLGDGMFGGIHIKAFYACLGAILAIPALAMTLRWIRRLSNPNLIPCAECGNWLSRRARSCPHCGCPTDHADLPFRDR
jgi:uncharacterized membrane protein